MTLQEAVIIWTIFTAVAIASLQARFMQDREVELSAPAVLLDTIHGSVDSYLNDSEVKGALRRCANYEDPGVPLGSNFLPDLSVSGFECDQCLDTPKVWEMVSPGSSDLSPYYFRAIARSLGVPQGRDSPSLSNYASDAPYLYSYFLDRSVRTGPDSPYLSYVLRNFRPLSGMTNFFPDIVPYKKFPADGSNIIVLYSVPNAVRYTSNPDFNSNSTYLTHEVELPFVGPDDRIYEGGISPTWWGLDFPDILSGERNPNRPSHEGATLSLPGSSDAFDGEPDDLSPFATAWIPCRGREVHGEGSRFASIPSEEDRAVEFPPSVDQAGYLPRMLSAASAAAAGTEDRTWMDLEDVVARSFADTNSGAAGFVSSPPGSDGFFLVGSIRFAGPRFYKDRARRSDLNWSGSGEYEALVVAIGREALSRRDATEILNQTRGGSWGFLYSPDSSSVRATAHDRSWEVGLTTEDSSDYDKGFSGISRYWEEFSKMYPFLCMRMAMAIEAAAGRLPDKAADQVPWGYVAGTHARLGPEDFKIHKVKMPSRVAAKTLIGLKDTPRGRCGLPADSSKGYLMARFQGSAY